MPKKAPFAISYNCIWFNCLIWKHKPKKEFKYHKPTQRSNIPSSPIHKLFRRSCIKCENLEIVWRKELNPTDTIHIKFWCWSLIQHRQWVQFFGGLGGLGGGLIGIKQEQHLTTNVLTNGAINPSLHNSSPPPSPSNDASSSSSFLLFSFCSSFLSLFFSTLQPHPDRHRTHWQTSWKKTR